MDELFFELIRVAMDNADKLSRMPNAKEWAQLYGMAKQQSLIGVCFAGVQCLMTGTDNDVACIGMTDELYQTWLGIAAKIQQRNEIVNSQCVELQKKLSEDGFCSTILKGQGVASYYSEYLQGLRQPGDIDVWIDGTREHILEYVGGMCPIDDAGDLHVSLNMFKNTEIEVHFTPSILSGSEANHRLQEWFQSEKEEQMAHLVALSGGSDTDSIIITAPTTAFNLVFLLLHIFRHYLYEGVGMRQLMDYYYVLMQADSSDSEQVLRVLDTFRLTSFAGAMMWVLQRIFGLESQYLLCEPDEKRGKRFLDIVMEGGNFGHSTKKYKITGWDKPISRLGRYARRNWYMLRDYPSEIMSNVWKKLTK